MSIKKAKLLTMFTIQMYVTIVYQWYTCIGTYTSIIISSLFTEWIVNLDNKDTKFYLILIGKNDNGKLTAKHEVSPGMMNCMWPETAFSLTPDSNQFCPISLQAFKTKPERCQFLFIKKLCTLH